MSSERELLAELQRRLAAADLDAGDLVEQAWADAREDVRATLRRLMTHDLLERCLRQLDGAAQGTPPRSPEPEPSAPRSEPGPEAPARTPEPGPEAPAAPAGTTEEPAASATEVGPSGPLQTYVYGIAEAGLAVPADVPVLPGGTGPRVVAHQELAALVCDVDPTTFAVLREPGPEGLETLAAAAHAHDATLAALAAAHTVLPLPLGTVVADDATVLHLLATHHRELSGELARLAGHAEWAVTAHLLDEPAGEGDREAQAATSGRDYLRRRQEARAAQETRWEARERVARELHGTLAGTAVESDTVGSRPVEDVAPPVLHGVYLLADGDRARFDSAVEHLRAEHPEAVIEVSGPWPPYHFTAVELTGSGSP